MDPHHDPATVEDRSDTDGRRAIERVVDGLEQRLEELIERQRHTRLAVLAGSLLVLGFMGVFALTLSSTLTRKLGSIQLQTAFVDKINQMLPALGQKFFDSAVKAAPGYGREALVRLEKVRPQLGTMLVDETERFAQRLHADLLNKTDAGLQRVTRRFSADLKRQLPSLTDQELDSVEERLRHALLIEAGGIADELEAKAERERDRIEVLYAKLPVDEVAKQPEDTLHRSFVHHVLMMVDQAVASEPEHQ
ncbi:MAG: hypothetical protein ACKOTB_06000 [Planctomycetia bacterium]